MKKSTYLSSLNLQRLLCLLGLGIVLTACGGDDASGEGGNTPTSDLSVTNPVVSSVTENSATVAATASGTGVVLRGVCYGTSKNPTIDGFNQLSTSNAIQVTLTGLQSATEYHVRAFVKSNTDVRYSSDVTFTTKSGGGSSEETTWVAPTYADDYRSISTWEKRSQWNLANVHDPSVVKGDDGYYYMYCTDAGFGNPQVGHGHFHCRRSKDLVNWEYIGATMPNTPSWVMTKLNEIRKNMGLGNSTANTSEYGYWAPCVRKVKNGLYRMYYCIVVPGTINGNGTWSERAFIGLMETADLAANNWQDKGYVLTNYSDKGLNYKVANTDWANCYFKYNAIDPSYIITPEGEHWLIYGSWHSGFAAVQLNAETGKTIVDPLPDPWGAANEAAYGKRVFTRQMGNRWQGAEAPEVVYRNGYYYLFMAYDALDVPYNTRVVRSTKIDGPYKSINGTDVTNNGGDAFPVLTHPYKFSNSEGWVGISHCAIFDDGSGNWYYASQGRFPVGSTSQPDWAPNAIMLGHVRSVQWNKEGWPVVMPERYAAVPQKAITAEEIAGTWEHIDLSYKYGEMKTSSTMTFAADGSITSGAWKGGKWSFDPSTNVLTANGVALQVQRECDWESSPRRATIVYAGINNTKTYWGKKK